MDSLEQMGLSYKEMEEMEIISPVLSISCDYHSMVHFDDVVVIEPRIIRYDGIRLEVEYRMTDKKTGELRTSGRSSHCFLNRSGRPISLKRSYPSLIQSFLSMPTHDRSQVGNKRSEKKWDTHQSAKAEKACVSSPQKRFGMEDET